MEVGTGRFKHGGLTIFREFLCYNPNDTPDICLTGLHFNLEFQGNLASASIKAISVKIVLSAASTSVIESPTVIEIKPVPDKPKAAANRRASLVGPTIAQIVVGKYFSPLESCVQSSGIKLEVTGEKTNKVMWNIKVKDKSPCLPSELPFALLIHHGVPFQAEITVSARRASLVGSIALKESSGGPWTVNFDGKTDGDNTKWLITQEPSSM